MKKIVVILLSITILLSIAGCQITDPSSSQFESSSSVINNPVSVSSTPSKASSAVSQTGNESATSSADSFAMTATNGTPENHITYIYYTIPISYMKQGMQILTGDGGWYNDVNEIVKNAPSAENLKKHYIIDMYSDFANIPAIDEYPELTDGFICSNGEWDFFPTKVRYEEYAFDHQPNKPEWDEYFNKLISNHCNNTPLIYINAWLFDWNGDGIEDAYVNACNLFYLNENRNPNPPYYDDTGTYTLTVFFLSGNEPICNSDDIVFNYVSKEPLTDDNIASYIADDGSGSEDYSTENYCYDGWISIQYDSQGDLIKCPIFISGEWGKSYEYEIIICDIDGDGNSELITTNYNEYSPYVVYKLIDGKPIEVFRITRPA
ncbi:MAG TPA: hypothetical protein PK629_00100 [Oscillospiraceae bacterium]|nr:hypothetical protein [Oscillospiraceae bacterium]HPK35505.1 hypothetical protein [Oscillospiraceae bacterium]HPR76043.1 hypothetical protein [Oscillospiraceae bacterium]